MRKRAPVQDADSDFRDDRAQGLARLAALQRLREHAEKGNRAAMLNSVQALIEAERRSLRDAAEREGDPTSGPDHPGV